jgi:hypothetical protein
MEQIETLVSALCPPTSTSGFRIPFTVERMCAAFGETLGGNAPQADWFAGHDVVCATRRTDSRLPYVAALLRRRHDGALRLIASDSIQVRAEPGADFMLGPQHVAVARDALLEACDDGAIPASVRLAIDTICGASLGSGDGPVDVLAVRRERDDLKDVRTRRDIDPAIEELRSQLRKLSSPDRRAQTLRILESIETALEQ